MSAIEYNTIHRTPLSQLNTLPIEAVYAFYLQCPEAIQRCLQRVIKIS